MGAAVQPLTEIWALEHSTVSWNVGFQSSRPHGVPSSVVEQQQPQPHNNLLFADLLVGDSPTSMGIPHHKRNVIAMPRNRWWDTACRCLANILELIILSYLHMAKW